MIFFKKKKPEAKPAAKSKPAPKSAPTPPALKPAPVQKATHERVLTAEGWQRRTAAANLKRAKG